MKAILVIDEMPKSCANCRLKRGLFCGESGNSLYDYIHYDDSINDKPSWCPLKPMPEKKSIKLACQKEAVGNDYGAGLIVGWNECLDEIVGETE